MRLPRIRTASLSRSSPHDPAGPPTPPKDVPVPHDDASIPDEPPVPALAPRDTPDPAMSDASHQHAPAPAAMALNPGATQTNTSITHQSLAGDSTLVKDQAESWATKEKTPAAWTLTMPVRTRSRRKSSKGPAPGKGHAHAGAHPPPSPLSSDAATQPARRSLLARVALACACCVSPSSRTHDIDTDEGVRAPRPAEQNDPEKQQSNKDAAEPPIAGPVLVPHALEPSSSTTVVPPPQTPTVASSIVSTVSPTSADSEIAIVLPPTPSRQLLPLSETDGLTSGAVQPPGSTGDELKTQVSVTVGESDDSDGSFDDEPFVDSRQLEEWEDEEQRLIRQGGAGIPLGSDGKPCPLLPALQPRYAGRKCLVLDLDETLVHSSLRPVPAPDYIVPVEIENNWHNFYVLKRPGVDSFLRRMGELYEVVVFTASLSKYADPVLDRLDPGSQSVAHRLFRESCYNHRGNYVKDLSQLGRPIGDTIILDNSPASYIFHPHNAVPVSSWFNDPHDTELADLCPFLEDLSRAQDVRGILNPFVDSP